LGGGGVIFPRVKCFKREADKLYLTPRLRMRGAIPLRPT